MWQTGHTMPPVRCDGGCDEQGVVSEGRMRDKPILAEKLKIGHRGKGQVSTAVDYHAGCPFSEIAFVAPPRCQPVTRTGYP